MELAGPSSIENDAHGIEKLLLKTQVSLTSLLHSEVNKLIQHIIVQDQDGQNNNTNYRFVFTCQFDLKLFFSAFFGFTARSDFGLLHSNNQNVIVFTRENATSEAPNIKGTSKFPNPSI